MNELPASPGLFAERDVAERAHQQTLERVRDARPRREAADADVASSRPQTIECTGIGAALGGTCGVLVAAVTAIDRLSLPALGMVIAGPFATALIGAGLGALAGALGGGALEARARRRLDATPMTPERSDGHGAT